MVLDQNDLNGEQRLRLTLLQMSLDAGLVVNPGEAAQVVKQLEKAVTLSPPDREPPASSERTS